MRLDRLTLTAFGRFTGAALDLAPGLNVIYGQNEAGKTTIQKFILGMLYGFKKRSQRRDYSEDLEKYRPWQGEEYRGALTYTLDRTGRTYRVERVFDPWREEVRIFDGLTGADLTGRFPTDRRKELLFAEEHLGIPEEVFRSTAWVGQMEVGKLEMGRELVHRVANMQESGREDLSVRNALRLLEERMREIGTDRAPTRPYARLGRQIEEKRLELERAAQAREQTMAWEAQLTEVRGALAEIDRELADLYRRIDWAVYREARERLERVRAGSRGAREALSRAEELSRYGTYPTHLKERLNRALAEAEQAGLAARRLRERAAELQERMTALRLELQIEEPMGRYGPEAMALLAATAQPGQVDARHLAALREEADRLTQMIARIDETLAPLKPAAAGGEQALVRVEAIEKEMASLRLKLEAQTTDLIRLEMAKLEQGLPRAGGWIWPAAALIFGLQAGYVGLGAVGMSAPGAGLLPEGWALPVAGAAGALALLCLVMFAAARRRARVVTGQLQAARNGLQAALSEGGQLQERLDSLERERERVLSGVGVHSTAEVRSRVIRFEQLSARRDGQQLRLNTIHSEISRMHGDAAHRRLELNRLIGGALGLTDDEVAAAPDAAERFRSAYTAYQEARHQAERIERELADLLQRGQEEAERAARQQAEATAVLAEAGAENPAEFQQGCALREEWSRAAAEAQSLTTALDSLLGGETLEQLERQVEHLASGVEGEAPAEPESSARLQAEARRLEARRADLGARASDLAARVETALRDLADTADLRREIEGLGEERRAYEEELAALDLAHQVITEVAGEIHREFAPRLNRVMGQAVAALTGGKYRDVRIDENLEIRTIIGDERTVDLTRLSGGTIDQFYFGLRVALLDLLTDGEERIALLLDDPFVQYDANRLRAALEYLAAHSRSRQIILMTCHRREVELARECGSPVQILDLSGAGG